MNQTEKLSVRQAIMWFTMFQLGSIFLIIPRYLTQEAGQDGWISALLAIALQFLLVPIYMILIRQFNGKTFNDYLEMILGKWGGKIVLFVFTIMYPFFIFITIIRNMTDYINTSVMTETPPAALAIMILVTVICIVRSGVSVIGRCAEIVFFGLVLIFCVNVFSFMFESNYNFLLPMFENGLGPIFKGAYSMLTTPFLENILFLFFIGNMTNPEHWTKVVMSSSVISGLIYTTATFFAIAILGAGVVANITYPTYFMVRTISLADFFERYEIAVTMLFYVIIFFRMALLLYVTSINFTSIFGLKDYRSLLVPIALISISLQKDIWRNAVEASQMIRDAAIVHGAIFGLIFPCIMAIIGSFKGKNNQSNN